MKTLILLLIIMGTRGSSLWSMSSGSNDDLDFLVHRDNSGVRVNAYVKDSSLVELNFSRHIKFFLFTRNQLQGAQFQIDDPTALSNSGFDPKAETKILIHGFANSISSEFIKRIKSAYLESTFINVVVVDWSELCKPPFYRGAVDNARQVGKHTAQLVARLLEAGASLEHTHLLGHSVGAHIAGVAGHQISHLSVGRVARITGLDPAKPMFELESEDFLLDSADADFVDCIHTCGGFLGLSRPKCSVDFYPNGGTNPQPGCPVDVFGICSHQRSYDLFEESIRTESSFPAVKCSAVESYSPVNCSTSRSGLVTMGEHTDHRSRGIYFLATASTPPFSLREPYQPSNLFTQFSWYFR